MEPKRIDNKLIMDGFVYYRTLETEKRTYWECKRYRSGECEARAITSSSGDLFIYKQPKIEDHQHPPNQHECQAKWTKNVLKRAAEDHPERPPSAILRETLPEVSQGALALLPDRENLKKTMRRARRKNLPPNPTTLLALQEIPDQYTRKLADDRFLIYDSGPSENKRVLAFATRRNLQN